MPPDLKEQYKKDPALWQSHGRNLIAFGSSATQGMGVHPLQPGGGYVTQAEVLRNAVPPTQQPNALATATAPAPAASGAPGVPPAGAPPFTGAPAAAPVGAAPMAPPQVPPTAPAPQAPAPVPTLGKAPADPRDLAASRGMGVVDAKYSATVSDDASAARAANATLDNMRSSAQTLAQKGFMGAKMTSVKVLSRPLAPVDLPHPASLQPR
jgi:hypothetical protein